LAITQARFLINFRHTLKVCNPGSQFICLYQSQIETIQTSYLRFGGIEFGSAAQTPSATPGAMQWLQLLSVRSDQYLDQNGPHTCQISSGLDNTYPYGDAGAGFASDSPGIVNNIAGSACSAPVPSPPFGELQDSFQATMYLLWDPALDANGNSTVTSSNPYGCSAHNGMDPDSGLPGTPVESTCGISSIPVPLASVTWGFCGGAIYNGSEWVPSCTLNPTTPQYNSIDSLSAAPYWQNPTIDQ